MMGGRGSRPHGVGHARAQADALLSCYDEIFNGSAVTTRTRKSRNGHKPVFLKKSSSAWYRRDGGILE
jgi:hypothetical protein